MRGQIPRAFVGEAEWTEIYNSSDMWVRKKVMEYLLMKLKK